MQASVITVSDEGIDTQFFFVSASKCRKIGMICTTDTILSLSLLWAWVWSKVQSVQKNMKILLFSTQPNQIFPQDNATNQLLIDSYKNPDFRKLFVFLSIFIVLQAHQNFDSISSHVPSLTGNLLPVDPSRSHRLHTHISAPKRPPNHNFFSSTKKNASNSHSLPIRSAPTCGSPPEPGILPSAVLLFSNAPCAY